MHRPPPPTKRRSFVLPLLLILACVGLAAAIAHKRVRRLQIEGARPAEIDLLVNVSTQVMSFRVEGDTNAPAEPVRSLLMSVTPERPPAPIIQSTPANARREYLETPPANPSVPAGRPQEIVSE